MQESIMPADRPMDGPANGPEDGKAYAADESYRLIGRLIEEIRLRNYSFHTGKSYISFVKAYLKSGRNARDFLLSFEDDPDIYPRSQQ